MELFLLGYLNRDFSGIVSWKSSTVDYNISCFFDIYGLRQLITEPSRVANSSQTLIGW